MKPPYWSRRAFAMFAGGAPLALWGQAKPALRRPDSYFGLHFDLHPSESDKALGRDVTEEMVSDLVRATMPDYVQYDSKGHVGWLGWPSQVGPSAPGIVKDSLEVWRKVTAREGVALYIHFSGLWDDQSAKRHPQWARVKPDGTPDPQKMSTFGPYVTEILIPQLREAAAKYKLDGVWVDGECWADAPDYCAAAKAAFQKLTGLSELPKSAKDAGWLEFLELNREQFRKYVTRYVTALHESNPGFQLTSNWMYSTFVPEAPTVPLDYLSGDYLGNASIARARMEARYFGETGKPWDLMAWGFQQADSNAIGHIHKPAVQLEQEASVVLAQGGGFQIYYQPSRAGHFEKSHVETMAKVARFCRERQSFSHKSETVPQVGVVYSKESIYRTSNKLFGGWGKADLMAVGMIDAMVNNGYSTDVVPDWKLSRVASRYPLLVLPDWSAPGQATIEALLDAARQGGKVLIAGAANAAAAAGALGYRAVGEPTEQAAFLPGSEVLANAKGLWLDVEVAANRVLERRYPELDSRSEGKPAAVLCPLGKGEVVVVPGPLGMVYAATHAPAVREFVKRLTAPLFTPMVRMEAPPTVELVLRRKGGTLYVHLLNATGMQVAGDYAAIDFVPEVGPVRVIGKGSVESVRLLPEDRKLKVEKASGEWRVEVPRLQVHAALAVL